MIQDPPVVTVYFKYLLVMACYYYTMVAVPKLAVLALYNRLLTLEPYRTIIRVLAAILILSAVVIVVMALNLCHPFAANWDPYLPGATCLDQQAFYTYASLPNIITDVAMLVLPMPVVWKLQASKKVKLGLVATFLTGSLYVDYTSFPFSTSSFIQPVTDECHQQRTSHIDITLRRIHPRERHQRRDLVHHRAHDLEHHRAKRLPHQRLPPRNAAHPRPAIR